MRKGRLEDIDDDGEDASIEMSSSQPSHIIYEREEKIKIDYSGLNGSLQDLEEADDVRKVERTFEKQISDLNATIHKIQAPNMKAMQKLDEAREKLEMANKDFDTVRRKAKQAKQNFERVKQERYDLFMACFEHVSNTIDGIYKSLARNQSAQAFLGPENPEEPYLEGINRITTQLEYEQKREDQLQENVTKFERMVQDVEDQLEASKKAESVTMGEIDKEMREIESLKSERSFLKSEVDKAEESCDSAKSEVSKITKELASITKQINQIEASLDNERASRHTILKQCKMDGIGIPMRKGRLEDIDDDGEDASIEMSSSQPSHIIYEREE